MVYLIVGGGSSGKSLMGETKAQLLCPMEKLYIATMAPQGKEGIQRVEKHRNMRLGKGFDTIEKYHSIHEITMHKEYGAIILECLSNLLANEIYLQKLPTQRATDKILDGINILAKYCPHLIIISNDIFREGIVGEEMNEYANALGFLNRESCKIADVVIEAVYGLEIVHKGVNINL